MREAMLHIVLFLHQTTTQHDVCLFHLCCISYYSYIKPQRTNSILRYEQVVYRTIPTSNYNFDNLRTFYNSLYIVLFLHQTTTAVALSPYCPGCISYYSYIKPQPVGHNRVP